jgi:hydrogenase/urease accessory protein HupE
MKRYMQLASLALCLAPTAALAHTGIGNTSGFMHGFMHPLSGLDHQLAMVLVGLFAYQLGGRALWLIPLTFVSLMAVGGFLGATAVPIASVDVCIALSVIVLVFSSPSALKLRLPWQWRWFVYSLFSTVMHMARRCRWMPQALNVEPAS